MKLRVMSISTTVKNGLRISSGLGLALTLMACSGDGRPFEEAVEINQLDLKEIFIDVPDGLVTDPELVVNPGDKINFKVRAINNGDMPVELSASNRRWSIAESSSASIDSNGRFTAIKDQTTAEVIVRVGRLEARQPVKISQAKLEMINTIKGAASMERCIPEKYSVSGNFTDGSVRGLFDVDWDVLEKENGFTGIENDEGRVPVTGIEPGPLNLVASAMVDNTGEVKKSPPLTIDVKDNLLDIDIFPSELSVKVDSTLKLSARGNYKRDDGGSNYSRDITDNIWWTVPVNNGFATLSSDSEGVMIKGVEFGSTSVTAACGDETKLKFIDVVTESGSGSAALAFDGASPRSISLNDGSVQLSVSTGSEYDSSNDVTNDADTTWSVLSQTPGQEVITLSPDKKGEITPVRVGTATVQVENGGDKATLNITVTQ